MPKLGDGMPYLGGYGLIATARVGRPSFPGILFAFLCESAIPTPVEQEQGIVYHKRTRQGGDARLLLECPEIVYPIPHSGSMIEASAKDAAANA